MVVGMIGWMDVVVIIATLIAVTIPSLLIYKKWSNKKKYNFKIMMYVRRNYGWITNTKLRGGIIKDEKGVSMFKIPYGHKKSYDTRELPSSDLISSDGTIHIAKVGETLLFLNPKLHLKVRSNSKTGQEIIEMDTNGDGKRDFDLIPVTTQTKYSTLYEIKRASEIANAGKMDWKPILAYGGLIFLFIGVIVVTYLLWEQIDMGLLKDIADSQKESARAMSEVADKLRGIK